MDTHTASALQAEIRQMRHLLERYGSDRDTMLHVLDASARTVQDLQDLVSTLTREIDALRQQNTLLRAENDSWRARHGPPPAPPPGTVQNQGLNSGNAPTTDSVQTAQDLQDTQDLQAERETILAALQPAHKALQTALKNRLAVRTYKNAQRQVAEHIALVEQSHLFDPDWYQTTYTDLAKQDPVTHFVTNGLYELRNPSAAFDSFAYHRANPDVTAQGIPALLHYLQHGQSDGREPYPVV